MPPQPSRERRVLWTLGHSNRTLEELLGLLEEAGIEALVDVRRFPGSRRHPQFGRQALRDALGRRGIAYAHAGELGGRRRERLADSPNGAWRVEAFNAYADYMTTGAFRAALGELLAGAQARRTAILCAEALPWRCHRRLIADACLARGWEVLDIVGPRQTRPHQLPGFARVEGERVTYPPPAEAPE